MRLMKKARALGKLLARVGYNVHIHIAAPDDIPEKAELLDAIGQRRGAVLIVLITTTPSIQQQDICVWLRTTFSNGLSTSLFVAAIGLLLEFNGGEWSVFSPYWPVSKKLPRIEFLVFTLERNLLAYAPLKGTNAREEARPAPPPSVSLNEPGLLLWNMPSQMRVGVRDRVEIRIAGTSIESKLRDGLKWRGMPKVENIEISSLMRVLLVAFDDDFKIKSLNNPDQYLRVGEVGRWDFDVFPLRAGQRALRVLVSIRFRIEGKEELADIPAFERDVRVLVAPLYTLRTFCAKNWQWIAVTIVIPTIVWLASRRSVQDYILHHL
jgi:hypothetical protein